MNELIAAVIATSWPLLVSGRTVGRRRAWIWIVALIVAASVGGGVLGALMPADALYLPVWTGLGGAMLSLILWYLGSSHLETR